MHIKTCSFSPIDNHGRQVVTVLHHPDQLHHSYMDKVAAPYLPEVREYVDRLKPNPRYIYTLVNALGAFEYYSSNINGDAFEEEMLIHTGPIYGYETFMHYAKVYAHHANKGDNARMFGDVELSCWHPIMKRVELVTKLDRELAEKVSAQRTIDKLDRGELPDVSMGTKVLFDICSISTDWELYRKALTTYDPKNDPHPGFAVLRYHKSVKPIKGLAVTKEDWSDWFKYKRNDILPDGRKVFVYNPYPRFFDISYVFIGAEKTSKVLVKLANASYSFPPRKNQYVSQNFDYSDAICKSASIEMVEKTPVEVKKLSSQTKNSEIIKDIVPSQFQGKAVPILEGMEPSIPNDILDRMSKFPLSESLTSPSVLGMMLKPKEFQRIVICRLGKKELADDLDREGLVFRKVDDVDRSISMGPDCINGGIINLLRRFIGDRSAYGPAITRRMLKITVNGVPVVDKTTIEAGGGQLTNENSFLDKISSAYNGYLEEFIEKISSLSNSLYQYPSACAEVYGKNVDELISTKTASTDYGNLLGAIPATYLMTLFARRKIEKDLRQGKEPDILTQLYADYPHLATTMVGLTALKSRGADISKKTIQTALLASEAMANGRR